MKRPKWVWFIFLWTLGSAAMTIYAYFLLFTNQTEISPELQQSLNNLKTIDYIVSGAGMLLGLMAATFLFMLRKQAYYLYWLIFIVGVIGAGSALAYEGISVKSISGIAFQLLITGLIIGYCKRLIQANILR